MQTIALFAMEPPVSLDGDDIRNEKVHRSSLKHHRFGFLEFPNLMEMGWHLHGDLRMGDDL